MVAYSIYSQTYVQQGIRIIGNICNDCSAVVERVPCKLNNERNEKHQTGAGRTAGAVWNATEKLGGTGLSQLPVKLSIKSFKL